ncbi:MAG: toprim domain-containing protein [Sphingomonas sp.]|nr:toprim domain-containing protein [Sphingomonas sp.]MDX3883593.1 toprim domain-containing protein [Sphingomonas sp.]
MRGGDPDLARRRLEEVRVIAARLNERARSLAPELLPNGRLDGAHWRCGNVAGDHGQSLCVDVDGPMIGHWRDFAACTGMTDAAGDMLDLVAAVRFGGRKKDAIAWARSWLGMDDLDPARLATERAQLRERQRSASLEAQAKAEKMLRLARGLFLPPGRGQGGAVPIPGTPADAYLAARGILIERMEVADRNGELRRHAPGALAFHPAVICNQAGAGVRLPAMIARILDGEGQHVATHRTWLAEGADGRWRKAPVPDPKKTIGRYQDARGGAYIPLWKGVCRKTLAEIDAGTDVYVSEGIEDGLSVALMRPELRVIAAVALSNMGNIVLPPQAGRLVVIRQNDASDSKAAAALEKAIARQQARGREVAAICPPPEFKDFNDWLMGKTMARPDVVEAA